MQIPESGLQLLQGNIDNRFGGDRELMVRGLDHIEQELGRPGMPLFEKVGNNCLVFFTNDRAKQVCEQNPETIQGVIVNDFDCWIHPEAVVIGSFLRGSVGSPAQVDAGSRVFYSNVIMTHVRRSLVTRSNLSFGRIDESTITDSFTSGNLREMHLMKSMARVGYLFGKTAIGRILEYDPRRDGQDTTGLVAHMLAVNGLRR